MRTKLLVIAFAAELSIHLPVSSTNSGFRFPERRTVHRQESHGEYLAQ